MKWKSAEGLSLLEFRRLTGVKKPTFIKMIDILQSAHQQKKLLGGRPNKLSREDMLLMTLEYLREYKTYFHISKNYGLSEGTVYEIIKCFLGQLSRSSSLNSLMLSLLALRLAKSAWLRLVSRTAGSLQLNPPQNRTCRFPASGSR